MPDVEDYSTTAASNTADFPEGQAPSTVNNAGRETQADIAAMYQRDNAVITAGGTADALTGTFSPVHTADVAGRVVIIQAASDNATTTPTFQLDSLTARTITKDGGVALVAGDIKTDGFIILKYDLINTAWELLNPMGPPSAAQGSSLVLLDTKTASASATVDFTSFIDGTYDAYKITINGMTPATNGATLQVRVSVAAAFKTDALYFWGISSIDQAGLHSPNGNATVTSMRIATSVNSATTYSVDGTLYFHEPDSTAFYKKIYGNTVYHNTGNGLTESVFGGYYLLTSAVDGIRFFCDTGNIAAGVFRLYGIKDS